MLFEVGLVVLLLLNGADGTDFEVVAAEDFTLGVQKGVDMKTIGLWSTGELTESEDELLLQLVGEIILSAEEDDSSLGDCVVLVDTRPGQKGVK